MKTTIAQLSTDIPNDEHFISNVDVAITALNALCLYALKDGGSSDTVYRALSQSQAELFKAKDAWLRDTK